MHAGFAYWLIRRYDLVLEQAHKLFDLESNFFGGVLGSWDWPIGLRECTKLPSQSCAKRSRWEEGLCRWPILDASWAGWIVRLKLEQVLDELTRTRKTEVCPTRLSGLRLCEFRQS